MTNVGEREWWKQIANLQFSVKNNLTWEGLSFLHMEHMAGKK